MFPVRDRKTDTFYNTIKYTNNVELPLKEITREREKLLLTKTTKVIPDEPIGSGTQQ